MIRVGLLGCGNIGHIIAKEHVGVEITALHYRIPERAEEAAKFCDAKVYSDFSSFVRADIERVQWRGPKASPSSRGRRPRAADRGGIAGRRRVR